MFTLEDIDMRDAVALLQTPLARQARQSSDTMSEADARKHPDDYFIVGN